MRQVSCIKLFTSAYIKMHKVNKKAIERYRQENLSKALLITFPLHAL